MSPAVLVDACQQSGVSINLAGEALTLRGHPDAVKAASDLVRPFKAELLQYLGHMASVVPAPMVAELTLPAELDRAPPPVPASDDAATVALLALLGGRGLSVEDAIELASRLTLRDQQRDERCVCLECAHLSGTATARRCSQWRWTGMHGPPIPADLVATLQRCSRFSLALSNDDNHEAEAPELHNEQH